MAQWRRLNEDPPHIGLALGAPLYGRKRYDEFAAFLDWLVQTIEDEVIDALLVAGDVFVTRTPGNRAQKSLLMNCLPNGEAYVCR